MQAVKIVCHYYVLRLLLLSILLLFEGAELALANLAHQAIDVTSPGTVARTIRAGDLRYGHTTFGTVFRQNLRQIIHAGLFALIGTLPTAPHNTRQVVPTAG